MESIQQLKEKAKRLHDGFVLNVTTENKEKGRKLPMPMAFYKTGLNRYEQINGNVESFELSHVIEIMDFKRSTDVYYVSEGDINESEAIDRLKLEEAVKAKYRGLPNIQVATGALGIAVTVKPADVLLVYPVELKLSEEELKQTAADHLHTENIGNVAHVAKCNFTALDKLAAQIKRYKAKGYYIVEDPEF